MRPYQSQVVSALKCLVSATVAKDVSADILKQLGAPAGSNIFGRIQLRLKAQWCIVEVTQHHAGWIALHDNAGRNALAQRGSRQQGGTVTDSDRPVHHAIRTNPDIAADIRQATITQPHADGGACAYDSAGTYSLCTENNAAPIVHADAAFNVAGLEEITFRGHLA